MSVLLRPGFKNLFVLTTSLLLSSLVSSSAFAAGALAKQMLDEASKVAKLTVAAGEEGNKQFVKNMQGVAELLGSANTNKALDDLVEEIKGKLDDRDKEAFAAFEKLVRANKVTKDRVQQLHDYLIYFTFRYRKPNSAKYMHCYVCSGSEASNNQVAKGFNYSILDASGTPLENVVKEINKLDARGVKAEIDKLMKREKFDDFDINNSPVMPGQEFAFLVLLKSARKSTPAAMKPYNKYAKKVLTLARESSGGKGYFGMDNPNRLHLIIQEMMDNSSASNEAKAEVLDLWYSVVHRTHLSMKKDGNLTLEEAFDRVMKSRGKDNNGKVTDQKFIDEVDELMQRCRFVGRS